MADQLLKRAEIRATACYVMVDSYGWFSVYPGDGPVEGEIGARLAREKTLDRAIDEATKTLTKRKVRVAVPFIDRGGTPGVATGIHAGTGNVLADFHGSRGIQLGGRAQTVVFPGDTSAGTVDEYVKAHEAKRAAERTIARIEKDEMVDLAKLVPEAIDAKLEEQQLAAAGDARRD